LLLVGVAPTCNDEQSGNPDNCHAVHNTMTPPSALKFQQGRKWT
jgi:hypothetical protein